MTREWNQRLPRTWWLQRATYFQFMVRELTSLAVLAYTGLMLWAMFSAATVGSFAEFYEFLSTPLSVWLHVVLMILALFHTGTWIALTPKVLVLWSDDERVEPDLIAGLNGILFLVVSAAVLWVVLI